MNARNMLIRIPLGVAPPLPVPSPPKTTDRPARDLINLALVHSRFLFPVRQFLYRNPDITTPYVSKADIGLYKDTRTDLLVPLSYAFQVNPHLGQSLLPFRVPR